MFDCIQYLLIEAHPLHQQIPITFKTNTLRFFMYTTRRFLQQLHISIYTKLTLL